MLTNLVLPRRIAGLPRVTVIESLDELRGIDYYSQAPITLPGIERQCELRDIIICV
jgi:hypothetical protein